MNSTILEVDMKQRRRGGCHIYKTAICLLCTILFFSGCNRERQSVLEKLKTLEVGTYEDNALGRRNIEDLERGIRFLEDEVTRTVDAGEFLGTYYKLAGIQFLDRNMFGLAAQFFDKALGVYPTNHILAHRAGVSLARLAQAKADPDERADILARAEEYYLYAIQINGGYVDALYALSVLYIFEMDREEEAEQYLERILVKESLNFSAMFLLARVYASYGRLDDAVVLYDTIIDESKNSDTIEQAKSNRMAIIGGGDGF